MNGKNQRRNAAPRDQAQQPQNRRPAQSPAPARKNTSPVRKAPEKATQRRPAPAPQPPAQTKAELTEARRREAQQALYERRAAEAQAARKNASPAGPAASNRPRRPAPANAASPAPSAQPKKQSGNTQNAQKPQKAQTPANNSRRQPAKQTRRQNAQPSAPTEKKSGPAPRAAGDRRPAPAAPQTIRQQTPGHRKKQREGKKITGSVKNLEVNRHIKTSRTRFRVKKKKQNWRVLLSRFAAFLVIFFMLSAVLGGAFYISLSHTSGIGSGDYTVQIGENGSKSTVTYTSSGKRAYANGTYNLSIDTIREYCDLTVTGDANKLRYIPRGSEGQSVAFEIGTNKAWVNGVEVRMEKPCFVSAGNLYVPVSFFDRYAKNLTIQHAASENKLTVLRTETAESVASTARDKVPVYEPIWFTLAEDAPLTGITEQSVDES